MTLALARFPSARARLSGSIAPARGRAHTATSTWLAGGKGWTGPGGKTPTGRPDYRGNGAEGRARSRRGVEPVSDDLLPGARTRRLAEIGVRDLELVGGRAIPA